MVIAAIEHIVIAPELCHGAPHIAGTRIRVQDVVMFQRNGWSAEQIVGNIEGVKLSQVYAALAYYYDHQAEINAAIEESEQLTKQPGGTHLQDMMARHGAEPRE